jgi:molecular chaperone DnaJ
MKKKNYYQILKLGRDADQDEIKKAHRDAAKRVHPDVCDDCGDLFREVQEAYETLSDPGRRAAYDRRLEEEKRPPHLSRRASARAPGFPDFDFSFGRRGELWENSLFGAFFGVGENTLSAEITLNQREARQGVMIPLQIPFAGRCPRCRGLGRIGPLLCRMCRGQGRITADKEITVRISPGIRDGAKTRIFFDPELILFITILIRPSRRR